MPEQREVEVHPRRPPVFVAVAAQAAAALICFGGFLVLRRTGVADVDLLLVLAGQGVLAAVIGRRWGLARWWTPLHLVLPMAAGAALTLDMPSWIYLAAFAALAAVFWNASGDRVPLYLSNATTRQALAGLLPTEAGGRFLDIGAGLGGTLIHLGRWRPDMQVDGIESAPLPFAICWLRLKLAGLPNVTLRYGDMWRTDLGPYDTVYAFLSPEPMPRLFKKVQDEMRPGTTFISNSFAVHGAAPTETKTLNDRRRTELLVWRL